MGCRKRWIGVVAAVALAVGLIACGGSDDSSEGASTDGSGSGKTYTVGIDIPFHPIFNYVRATADDCFAGKPYEVKFDVLDATTQVPAFGAGRLDVMTTVPSFIPRVKQQYGIDAVEFFPLARWTIGPQILVEKGSGIESIEDLQGKKVAIPPLTTRFGAEEAAILAATGQNIRDYFELEETEAAAQQLTQGRVDAAFIEAPTTYPLLKTGKFEPIYSVHDAFLSAFDDPAVVNGGYIASDEFIEGNEEFVQDLIACTQEAWNTYNENSDEVNQVASEISGVPVEQLEVVGEVLDLNEIPPDQRAITAQDVETWKQIFPLLEQSGFVEQAPEDPAKLFRVTEGGGAGSTSTDGTTTTP